jgi:hypothetical protein
VGTNEGGAAKCPGETVLPGSAADDVMKLERVLRNVATEKPQLDVVVEPCAVHNEAAWARRLPRALTFLWPGSSR